MNVNIKNQRSKRVLEAIKWTVVTVLLIAASIGNCLYRDVMLPLRILVLIILITAAGCVALSTKKGESIVTFIQEARTEIRKVVWPTSQETLQTTLVVIVVTAVMSLILWGLDGILIYLISFITRLRF